MRSVRERRRADCGHPAGGAARLARGFADSAQDARGRATRRGRGHGGNRFNRAVGSRGGFALAGIHAREGRFAPSSGRRRGRSADQGEGRRVMNVRVLFATPLLLSLPALAEPRLIVPPDGVVFGEVPAGTNVSGRVELRNGGNVPVHVSRVKACCGATAELSPRAIPPNGVATLSVSLQVQDVGPFSKTIRLSCDDPEQPLVSVPVTGTVVAGADVSKREDMPSRHDGDPVFLLVFGGVLSMVVLVDLLWRPARDAPWRRRARRWLALVNRIGIGGLFIYTGCVKMGDWDAFAELVSRYDMLPSACVRSFAVALPFAEALAGAALAFSPWTRLAAGLVAGLLLVFMAALAQAAVRGLDVSCGCFGGPLHRARLELLLALGRDALLLIPSLWLAMRAGKAARSQKTSPQA